jgi:hypothetical protein
VVGLRTVGRRSTHTVLLVIVPGRWWSTGQLGTWHPLPGETPHTQTRAHDVTSDSGFVIIRAESDATIWARDTN